MIKIKPFNIIHNRKYALLRKLIVCWLKTNWNAKTVVVALGVLASLLLITILYPVSQTANTILFVSVAMLVSVAVAMFFFFTKWQIEFYNLYRYSDYMKAKELLAETKKEYLFHAELHKLENQTPSPKNNAVLRKTNKI